MQSAKPIEPQKAESPRVMSRDDRLIIMDKIRDVNDGDRYSSGWSDQSIGEYLGVPWAWVKEVRENILLFKDEINPELKKLNEEIDRIRKRSDDHLRHLESDKLSIEETIASLDALTPLIERVKKEMSLRKP